MHDQIFKEIICRPMKLTISYLGYAIADWDNRYSVFPGVRILRRLYGVGHNLVTLSFLEFIADPRVAL